MVTAPHQRMSRLLDTFTEELGRWSARTLCVGLGSGLAMLIGRLLG